MFWWYVANSFHSFLSADNLTVPTRAPPVQGIGRLKPNVDASNLTWIPRTQCGHLEPNLDTSNPTRTPRTQRKYFEPNTDPSSPTQTCPDELRRLQTCQFEHEPIESRQYVPNREWRTWLNSCIDRGRGLWTMENVEVGDIFCMLYVVSPTSCVLRPSSNIIVIPDIPR